MKIEKINEPRFVVELSKSEIGIIAYVLGQSSESDFARTPHAKHVTGKLSAMYNAFNDALASS
jgi:hypothetical protein